MMRAMELGMTDGRLMVFYSKYPEDICWLIKHVLIGACYCISDLWPLQIRIASTHTTPPWSPPVTIKQQQHLQVPVFYPCLSSGDLISYGLLLLHGINASGRPREQQQHSLSCPSDSFALSMELRWLASSKIQILKTDRP